MQAKETVDMKHKLSSSSQQLEATGLTPEQSLIGVRPDSNGRFLACLTICSHSLQLGVYDSEAQAVKARDVFALALFGPDAVTNAPADHYIPVEVAAMRQQLLREQQQQSQASLSCSPCFASEPAPVAAVKTAPAPATAEAAACDALQEGPTAALPAHVVAQPAVGSKRPHSRSSISQEAATGAPAAADSLQEKSPEQPQPAGAADGSPSCKRHKPTPAAVLPQPADTRADHGTGQQQQTQTQQMQAMSAAAAGKQQTSLAGSQTAAADAAGTRTGLQEQCMAAADAAAHHHQKQQQGAAGFHQPKDPGMLSGLLCLIEAAASLPAEEQAVLLPAHARRSNLGSSSAAQHPNQPQDHKASKEHKEWQPSMATQQCADGLGRVPASCSDSAAAQGTFLQAPASSQQAPASHSLAGTAVQGQQAAAMHQAQQLQQQQQAGQLAGVEEALQFLQSDAGQSAVQQMELEFKQQQAHDWHDFLQSSSAQQGLHSLQKLFQTTCTTAQQQRQQPQQAQQKHYLQSGSHQLPASHQYSAAAGHAAQQQQQFGRFFAVPPSIPTAGQQLDPMQWLQQQQQQKQQGRPNAPGQPASKMTSLQRALAGASNLPAAATAGAAPLAQQQQQQQQLKPCRSNDGAEPHLLSRGSSGHSDGSTYRSSRSPSPDDLDAAAAAAGGEAGRGRSVSADSSSGAAAAAAAAAASGADVLAAMHAAAAAAAAAGMYGAGGGYADEEEAYAVGMYGAGMTGQYGAGAAAAEAGFDVLGGELGGTGSRHSARPKRPTERMQEMQQQMQQQHKQRKGKQQEQQQWDGQLQDFFAAWGGAGLPGQFAQLLFQQQQSQEQPWVPQRQQQQLKKKRVNLAWKPASGKASGTDRGDAAAAAAGAGGAADGDLAAAAEGGELPAPVMKVTGPGCVSHAQNPTGQMGVRMRKNRYEAFIAVPPFRYLYLGQHATPADAVRTRDTAMLAIFGPEAAAAHGSAWLSPGAAESIAADEVAALAAKLMKKEQAAGVMKQHGTFGVRHQAGQAGVVPAAAAAAAPVGAAYEEAAAAAVV